MHATKKEIMILIIELLFPPAKKEDDFSFASQNDGFFLCTLRTSASHMAENIESRDRIRFNQVENNQIKAMYNYYEKIQNQIMLHGQMFKLPYHGLRWLI